MRPVFLFWSNNNMNKLDITIVKYTHTQIDIILKIYRSRAHHESSVHPQRVQWLCQTWGTVHTAPRLPGSLPAAGPAASPPGHYPWTLTHTNGDSTCTHTHTHTHTHIWLVQIITKVIYWVQYWRLWHLRQIMTEHKKFNSWLTLELCWSNLAHYQEWRLSAQHAGYQEWTSLPSKKKPISRRKCFQE